MLPEWRQLPVHISPQFPESRRVDATERKYFLFRINGELNMAVGVIKMGLVIPSEVDIAIVPSTFEVDGF